MERFVITSRNNLIIVTRFILAHHSCRNYQQVENSSGLSYCKINWKRQCLMKTVPSVKLLLPQFQQFASTIDAKKPLEWSEQGYIWITQFSSLHSDSWPSKRTEDSMSVNKRTSGARTLQIDQEFSRGWQCNNFWGPVWLIRHGYKSASKYSPNVAWFDTVKYQFVTSHLKEYKAV